MSNTSKFLKPDNLGMSNADPGGVLKNAHNPQKKSIDVSNIDVLVPEKFDRIAASFNINEQPTSVSYYLGILPKITEITCNPDVSGSLNNKYFNLYSGRDEIKFYVWYNVNSVGVDPAIPNSTGIEIQLNTNDIDIIVAAATQLTLNSRPEFEVTRINNKIRIITREYGVTTNTSDVDTGFNIQTAQDGNEELIKNIQLTYSNNNPVYKGQELKNYIYNIYTTRFEFNSLNNTIIKDSNDNKVINTIISEGNVSFTGLKNGGQDTIITATDSEWTKLERSSITNPIGSGIKSGRNSIKITNYSSVIIYTTINEDPNGSSQLFGDKIFPENSQFMDIAENDLNGNPINVWVKSSSGDAEVFLREIA